MSTAELLAEYAVLLNRFGPDSEKAASFYEEHRHRRDFAKLADVARALKKTLTADVHSD